MENRWTPLEFDYKDLNKNKDKIFEIIHGIKPVIIIRNFFDPNLCQEVSNRANNFLHFENNAGPHKKIGTSLVSFLTHKSDYFYQAKSSKKTLHEIFDKIEDPRKKIHRLLSEFFPFKSVEVATEQSEKYACGVIRFHELGDCAQIHRDCVQFEAPNFNVSKLNNQLSTVLYLQQSEEGGELVIYNKSWEKSDERFREINFGYSCKVVGEDIESVCIKPRCGDLIIINPKYYHEINKVKGKKKRISLGLFFAFSKYNNKIMTWT